MSHHGQPEVRASSNPVVQRRVTLAAVSDLDRSAGERRNTLYAKAGRHEAAERVAAVVPRDVLLSPEFAPLRDDPRLTALRRKFGLPQ